MREIIISDETLKRSAATKELALSFKEKLELAKLLDNLGVSVIEIEGIERAKADSLRIKSVASLVKNCTVAVPVALDGSDVEEVWNALAEAKNPRLQVQAAVSPSRMEYVHKKKAPQMIECVVSTIKKCVALTKNVEFIAEDATRADSAFLCEIFNAAIEAGVSHITVCDDAGIMLPHQVELMAENLRTAVPGINDIWLGISCSNELYMAVSTCMSAIGAGVDEVKTTSYPLGVTELPKLAKAVSTRGSEYGAACSINMSVLGRVTEQIERICKQGARAAMSYAEAAAGGETVEISLSISDDKEAVAEQVSTLGYDLTDEDIDLVYEAFLRIASKKSSIGARELDAIVASAALQVPATYKLGYFTVNSGNTVKATAFIRLESDEEALEGLGMGSGPIDAAFAAIEDVIGRKFELDDWQMQSVTQGQEAMGEAIVKLVSDGKIFSGRGISTDIVGSSIRAYLNAVNKIVYEENN